MELTIDQTDGLTELINIGYGRAASALSQLTGYRITLEVPQVAVHEIDKIAPALNDMLGPSVASVNQDFMGPISGSALLLLDEPSAIALSALLTEGSGQERKFDFNAREIITEVGNILLNACLGVFGNMLKVPITFAVPRLQVESMEKLIGNLVSESSETLKFGLMIHTRFQVKTRDVKGYLVIVLGIASLDRLMQEIEAWETRQSS